MDHAKEEVCYLNTPVGWLRVAADTDGITSTQVIAEPPKSVEPISLPHLKEAYRQLNEYFRGERMSFNLPLNPRGTAFQRSVWEGLQRIPFGTTISYKELAEALGCPDGASAVGQANNSNPLPIVVPSHRALGNDAEAAAAEIRKKLLKMEGLELA